MKISCIFGFHQWKKRTFGIGRWVIVNRYCKWCDKEHPDND